MEKKVYVTPEVTKVEFDGSDRITASTLESACGVEPIETMFSELC